MSDNLHDLPPLPPTSIYREGPYTDECMRSYAAQAVADERERCAKAVDDLADCEPIDRSMVIRCAAAIRKG